MTATEDKIEHLDNDTLQRLWSEYQSERGYFARDGFRNHLRLLAQDASQVDEVVDCITCGDFVIEDHCKTRDGVVCESCHDSYAACDSCDECVHEDDLGSTLHDTTVCIGCRDSHYSYCGACDGWYADDYADGHDHEAVCDCEAPHQRFTIRNDGEGPLRNDTRVTVTLPAGIITDEGLGEIARYLRSQTLHADVQETKDALWGLSYRLGELGVQWQTREGNFTKRLSRFAYKTHGLKVTPEILSHVGCIARDHSTAVDFQVEITRNLNLSAEEFGHEESCWFTGGSYGESRCALKSNGGFGIRTFDDNGDVSGRAWVMPLRSRGEGQGFGPTLDTETPDAFVVFNGYGDLSGYAATRIVSHMAGWTYRKIGFHCSPMYINGESGYLVAPEEIAKDYTDGRLVLTVDTHANLTEKELAHVA
jgi:hypothetical protein